MRPFRFDRRWDFDAAPDAVWEALTRTDDYRRWWPWLREFSGDGLVPGGCSTCVVRAPVLYTLRFTVTIAELSTGKLIAAEVDGDLRGEARLEVRALGARRRGSEVRLSWEVELVRPVLRTAARFGRPVMEWGHDCIVRNGFEEFCREALRVKESHDDEHDDHGTGTTGIGSTGTGSTGYGA